MFYFVILNKFKLFTLLVENKKPQLSAVKNNILFMYIYIFLTN